MSEHNHRFDPTNDQPQDPDDQAQTDPAEEPIPGIDVHDDLATPLPHLQQPPRGRRLARPQPQPGAKFTFQQRLLILDAWRRSGLPAGDFAPLVGLSKHTLYLWKQRFDKHGPAGLAEQPRGAPRGNRLSDVTRRAIVMLTESHPDWGCQRISDALERGPALSACPAAIARVLHEEGYQLEEVPTRAHRDHVRHFERARPPARRSACTSRSASSPRPGWANGTRR